LTYLCLEENDDRNADVKQTIAKNKFQRCEILLEGKPVEENYYRESGGHWSCPRAS
jgi:hypothetical protein